MLEDSGLMDDVLIPHDSVSLGTWDGILPLPFTILAPTNAAWTGAGTLVFLKGNNLQRVLECHLIADVNFVEESAQLQRGGLPVEDAVFKFPTMEGSMLMVQLPPVNSTLDSNADIQLNHGQSSILKKRYPCL